MGTGTSSKASITHIRVGSSCGAGAGAGGPYTTKTLHALKACYGNEAYASPTFNVLFFFGGILLRTSSSNPVQQQPSTPTTQR